MAQSFDPAAYAVLVVEDDPFVRMEAADLAQEAGFKTYTARDADAAIRMLERHSDIRILFTDIEIPGSIDGLKLARFVRDRWPPVQILVVSGRGKVEPADLPDDGLFFPKPYDPDAILRALSDLGALVAGRLETDATRRIRG